MSGSWTRRMAGAAALLAAIALSSDTAAAHIGGLSGALEDATVPVWLTVVTGGVVIGASFLFTSLLTDHEGIRAVNAWEFSLPVPRGLRAAVTPIARAGSVAVLGVILASALLGPRRPTASFAILVVWAGWWAGYTMSVYLLGNSWPLLNPWRAIASVLPRAATREYPERLGAWPAVVGLLALIWVEVISPVARNPRLLFGLIVAYTLLTLAGAVVYGDPWFEYVDPVSRVFRCYGRLAPIQRTDRGIAFTLPTTALTEGEAPETPGTTAFVVALLWVTTYDGFVSTPSWAAIARPLVGAGVPAPPLYLFLLLAGFGLFLLVYRLASRKARETAGSYVAPRFIERWFAPALLPIAAGYHLAHFLGYFLSLLPALVGVLAHPIASPPSVTVLSVPGWFGTLQLLFVLLGHVLAIWVAHSLSFDLFPGIFKPIRSQYPFVAVMIFYTMTSMWVVVQPFTPPPFV